MTRVLLAMLGFYRRWLSPAVHSLGVGGCKYLPTCSEYAAIAISMHGPVKGSALAVARLLRCHPFAHGGLDPVPAPPVTAGSPSTQASQADQSPLPRRRPFPHEPLP